MYGKAGIFKKEREEYETMEVSENDFNALQETLYLARIPGLYQDLKEGQRTSVEACTPDSALMW